MKPSNEPRRLHPMTLVQRVLVSSPALIFILLPVLRNPDSSAWFNLIFAGAYALLILPWIALYYIRFRYWITPKELIIHSGVITRRKRNIPIERVQNIEIEQSPLPRLLGTAKVAVYTAGSAKAEGVLEYVSLREAREIRDMVREMQRNLTPERSGPHVEGQREASEVLSDITRQDSPAEVEEEHQLLYSMSPKRVLLSGAFQFSLFYIAAIFSVMQYIEPDPTVFFGWLIRGPLEPWGAAIEASPWMAGALGAVFAVLLGWFSSILITFNRYFRFSIHLRDGKLHRKHGLLTLAEGTIPLRRIQAYIIRTNPMMKRFGYYRLELQTMGIDVKEKGFQVAAPFASIDQIDSILSEIGLLNIPKSWQPVSKLTIRRAFIRYSLVLAIAMSLISIWFDFAVWGGALLPVIVLFAVLRYQNMGYAAIDGGLAVKRGIFRKHIWLMPTLKIQTITRHSSFFQRRLGLSTLYVDTAGASPMSASELVDLPKETASMLLRDQYLLFNP